MSKWWNGTRWWRLGALLGGGTYFLESCDPTLRATVEDGLISVSTSLFGSFLRAAIELGQEGSTTTAAIEMVQRIVA